MIEKIKNNKFLLVLLCLIILVLIVIIFRFSYAYLMERIEEGDRATINIDAEDLYALNFIPGTSLNLDVTAKTLPEDNLKDLTIVSKPRVELKDKNPENLYQYYVYLSIPTNPFVYTEEGTPEILLKIQKGEEEITQIDNLTYNTDLQAFDITTFHGTIPIRENIEVHSNGTNLTTEEWTFTLTYRNLDIDQSINLDKSLTIQVIMQENKKELYHIACQDNTASCTLAKTSLTDNYMFYHDEYLTNGAEDLNYRFSGSNEDVKNYVCLDSQTTGACETDEDLYRIIGLFKNKQEEYEMKLIKANAGTTTQLGDESVKISDEDLTPSAYASGTYYYYWNSSNGITEENKNINMWKYSNLNKVNLNNYFYNYIINKATYLQDHITEHTWITGGYPEEINNGNPKEIYDAELGDGKVKVSDNVCYNDGDTSTTRECSGEYDLVYPAHIGLMYISDYMYGTIPSNWTTKAGATTIGDNNWLKLGSYEWSISRLSSNGLWARIMYGEGRAYYSHNVYNTAAIRPSFYLTSDAKIKEGNGSKESPYRITFE